MPTVKYSSAVGIFLRKKDLNRFNRKKKERKESEWIYLQGLDASEEQNDDEIPDAVV